MIIASTSSVILSMIVSYDIHNVDLSISVNTGMLPDKITELPVATKGGTRGGLGSIQGGARHPEETPNHPRHFPPVESRNRCWETNLSGGLQLILDGSRPWNLPVH